MVSIDVHDLPEPIAQAIAAMVDTIRIRVSESQLKPTQKDQPAQLPVWPGTTLGSLRRSEIYDDVA
jgi:hypothetical protein